MSIEVIEPGFLTTVQDLGRWGSVRLGVVVSGALDPYALMAANVLVGNNAGRAFEDPGAACLEITLVGPTLLFREACVIAVTGADLGPRLNGIDLDTWKTCLVAPDSRLEFTGRRSGARAYLAVAGGVDVRPWLGSRSTYLTASAGGLNGRPLAAGDTLPIGKPAPSLSALGGLALLPAERPRYTGEPVLRVILGPQADRFTPDGVDTFFASRYQVMPESNRMAYRLEGPRIAHRSRADVSSCGIPLGGIQVPGNGNPILMLADHPMAGGYAQIAAVIQADIPLAAQCLPGECLRFRAVSLEEARESLRLQMGVLQSRTAEDSGFPWD